jgi:hypothetical protein
MIVEDYGIDIAIRCHVYRITPAVHAHIKLPRDKDLSWDLWISRDIPEIPGI